MRVEFIQKSSLLDSLQRGIAFAMVICFLIGFVPFYFNKIYSFLVILIAIQIILSIIRGKLLNIFFEVFIVAFIFFSLIPIIGYLFRFLGFLFSLLDMAGFNGNSTIKVMNINNFGHRRDESKNNSKGIKSKKKKPDFKEAEFREK